MTKITEKQLIEKFKKLNEIKPRQEWVVFAKSQILGETEIKAEKALTVLDIIKGSIFQKKTAFAFATVMTVMLGVFGFAQNTLPGDALFTVKKMTEQSQAALLGASSVKNSLDTLDKRTQDLARAVKDNKEANISSAVTEVKQSIVEATKNITETLQKDPTALKELAQDIKKVEDNKEQLKTLGVNIDETEMTNLYKMLVEQEIASLETLTLTEEQQTQLTDIKALADEGKYAEAFEKILTNQ